MTNKTEMDIKTVVAAHSLRDREINLSYSVFKNEEEKRIATIENGGKRPSDNRRIKVIIDQESLIIQALSDPQSLIVKAQRLDRLVLNAGGERKMKDEYKLSEFFQTGRSQTKSAGLPTEVQLGILSYRSVFKACKSEGVAMMAAREKCPDFENRVIEFGIELPKA